ncbi:hypothetical protein D3C81_1158670 [compost metagenome]
MGLRIVLVAELVEHLAAALGLQLQRQIAGAFHALGLAHLDQLGAVGAHRRLALGAHVVRHDQDHPVALDRRGHGQGDAGVAGSGLDQGVAGLDVAAQLGMADHRQRRAILHRAGRVVAFQLDQKGVRGLARQALQAHQRGVADAVGDGGILHGHGSQLFAARTGGAHDSGKRAGPITRQGWSIFLVAIIRSTARWTPRRLDRRP